MSWSDTPLRILSIVLVSLFLFAGCDPLMHPEMEDGQEKDGAPAVLGSDPVWSPSADAGTPYGCTLTELDGDLQPFGPEMKLPLSPSLLAARVPAFAKHGHAGRMKTKELHFMFRWPASYVSKEAGREAERSADGRGPQFVARCVVPKRPDVVVAGPDPEEFTPSVFSDLIRERLRPMMHARMQRIRAFQEDRATGLPVRPGDVNGRAGASKSTVRLFAKSGEETYNSLNELFDAATEEVTSTTPDCTRVGVWYWINGDGTYEIESASCEEFAPPLDGSGSGMGGGDGCYDGSGDNISDPLCELTAEEPVEIDANEVAWGVARRIGQKLLKALQRGEDLLDAKTWKNILESEWADAAQAGLDTQAALNGDVVALISVLDYIVSQISPAGGVFDMLQTLKLGDHLGLSWYDNIIGGLQSSQHFPQLAQAVGDFANTIDDVDLLERVGKLDKVKDDKYRNPIYRITSGDSQQVMDSFAERWGRPSGGSELQMGDIQLNRYSATGGSGRMTINVNRGGNEFKVRFEET